MQILYFGSGAFGLPTLQALAQHHQILGVVTQPDKPAGRGGKPTPTPIADWAQQNLAGVPVFKPDNVNDPAIVEQLRELVPPDPTRQHRAWVVIAFGQKLGKPLLADVFAMNLHASLLPRWRGAAPINHAILAGDAETGNTVITLADKMDAGLILAQSRRPILQGQTTAELHDLLASDGPQLVLDVLQQGQSGTLNPTEQDASLVTIAPKLSKADAWIDFSAPAEVCCRRILGLNPWPGVTVQFQNAPLKILRATPLTIQGAGIPPGIVFDPRHGMVTCGPPASNTNNDNKQSQSPHAKSQKNSDKQPTGPADHTAMRIDEVQPPGKRAMHWSEFHRGRKITPGEPMNG